MMPELNTGIAANVPARAEMTAAMIAGESFTRRAPRLGMGEPLDLRGGDSHALLRALELGFEWQLDLRNAAQAAFASASVDGAWFKLDPLLLLGEPGVGRTHVARRLAHVAGVPHVALDLTDSSGLDQLWPRPCGPDLILPSLPVLAMALGGCANPLVSVVGIERLDGGAQRKFASLLEPELASRWVDYATGATVDLRQVSWIVQCSNEASLAPALRRLLRPIELVWPDPRHLPLHHAEVLAEAAIDLGVIDRIRDRAAEGLRRIAGADPRSTAALYERASRWLVAEFN